MSQNVIVAVTRQKVDGRTLHAFTTQANKGLRSPYEVVLFAKPDDDLLNVLTAASEPEAFDSVQHASKIFTFTQGLFRLILGTNSKGQARIPYRDLAIIQLFEPSASAQQQCFLCIETNDKDTIHHEQTIGFQCRFDHVPAAIAALDDLTALYTPILRAKTLRNEAVRCGGIWDADVMARLRANEAANESVLRAHLDMLTYPPFVGQRALENDPSTNDPYVPPWTAVFIVSDEVSLETVNEFLQAADQKQNMKADQDPRRRHRFAIITDLSATAHTSTAGAAMPPLEALPAIPKGLTHATPEACIAYARSRLPGQKQRVQWKEVVVLDAFSESDKTAILCGWDNGVLNGRQGDGRPALIRTSFDELWLIQAGVQENSLAYDLYCDMGCRAEDGVYRGM